jgi:hypothetical protein
MSDFDKIDAHLSALADGDVISDACARMIASQWHGGQFSALYALASSGAIEAVDVSRELQGVQAVTQRPASHTAELNALAAYVRHHGARGPVPGWSSLWL